MSYSEQTHLVNYPEDEITSDSNTIPYSQYLFETQNAAVQDTNSSAQNDSMILSVFKQLSNQVTKCNKVNKDNLIANESLSAELERYKERVKFLEERQNADLSTREKLIMDDIIHEKMHNFGKHFVPQQELSDEQAFRLQTLHPNTDQSASSLVKIEAPGNFLRKFKGKDIVNNVAQGSNDTTIAPGMYKLDLVTLASKDKNNKETHIYYLKHNIEQAAMLREIVEQANSLNPLDSASYSARVSRSTKSSRLKSTENTKNDRILQISSSTQKKNKVEDHSRIVKSSLNKSNYVVESSRNANVQHSKLNTNSKLMCVKCNSSMFDARHELCFLEFVSDMNASSKSKSVKKAKKKEEWKPIGKFLGTVKFGNDQIAKIIGYSDYQIGNITISRVYYVEGLGHNPFFVGQFCDSNLEVAFRKHTCFVRNLEDEYFNPPTIVVSPVPVVAAPRAVDLADSLVSMSID
ncbi:hypothetical protein Tco_0471097 [Tanacetum coccineum]